MNAVRMSHYPPDTHFLDACDELGPLRARRARRLAEPRTTRRSARGWSSEMVTRDVNHPSILFWDNGNEGGWNTALDDDFAQWDPQRRTVLHPWATFGGINTDHYRDATTSTPAHAAGGTTSSCRPSSCTGCTTAAAAPGSTTTGTPCSRARAAGGFIWAFVDEGVARTDRGRRGSTPPATRARRHRRPVSREGRQLLHAVEIWSPVVFPGRALDGGGPPRREPLRLHRPLAVLGSRGGSPGSRPAGEAGVPYQDIARGALARPGGAAGLYGAAAAAAAGGVARRGRPVRHRTGPGGPGGLDGVLAISGAARRPREPRRGARRVDEWTEGSRSRRARCGSLRARRRCALGQRDGRSDPARRRPALRRVPADGARGRAGRGTGPRALRRREDGHDRVRRRLGWARVRRPGCPGGRRQAVVEARYGGGRVSCRGGSRRAGACGSSTRSRSRGRPTCSGSTSGAPAAAPLRSTGWPRALPRLEEPDEGHAPRRLGRRERRAPRRGLDLPEFRGYFHDWSFAALDFAGARMTLDRPDGPGFLGVYTPRDGAVGRSRACPRPASRCCTRSRRSGTSSSPRSCSGPKDSRRASRRGIRGGVVVGRPRFGGSLVP